MRLLRIRLKNFGVYRGYHEIDFSGSEPQKPIVLVQGANGSGKTTLLEAIRLGLYGQRALGARVAKVEYEEYLKSRISRPASDGTEALVSLVFSYVRQGRQSTYEVTRSWTYGPRIRENIALTENGRTVRDFDPGEWNHLLRELVPPGLADLFFFDGERIRQLATPESHDLALAESVRTLLGLDVAWQLQQDLALLMARHSRNGVLRSIRKELIEVEEEIRRLRAELASINEKRSEVLQEKKSLEQQLDTSEQRLVSNGSLYFEQQKEMKHRLEVLASQRESLLRRIRDLCAGTFPFALAGAIVDRLLDRLRHEETVLELQQSTAVWDHMAKLVTEILVKRGVDANIVSEALQTARDSLNMQVRNQFIVHDLSMTDRQELRVWVELSRQDARCMAGLLKELREVENELADVQQRLDRVPSGDALLPLINEHKRIASLLSECNIALGRLNEKREDVSRRLEAAVRRRKELLEKMKDFSRSQFRDRLVARLQRALDEYEQEVTRRKIAELEVEICRCLNALLHKSNFVAHVEVEPREFVVTLYDSHGRVIPREALSAGEQQLYAIAVLWALRRVSRRPLPVVIDTPLGRLDLEHRENLLLKYFPVASHQVILLVTDAEVSASDVKKLVPYLAAFFRLRHDQSAGITTIERVEPVTQSKGAS